MLKYDTKSGHTSLPRAGSVGVAFNTNNAKTDSKHTDSKHADSKHSRKVDEYKSRKVGKLKSRKV